ncbi:unnamed protein product [Dracunculus medinensis]|uniref:G_PROTEIN_RECEP_F1_2 domain-containing protein n=1 Tax=Dracunculus medinensis TaxID=318479 RepID=A0A0N4UE85_DRAME|nr:unnamed protein product [Dracunculus medinensis]
MFELNLTVVQIVYIFITIVGVVGNVIILIVFGISRNLQTSTNALIMNLAFADLMFLIFCVPFTAISYAKPWPFPDTICYMTIYLQYVTAYASVWTLAVVCPISAISLRNIRNVIGICVLMWITILLCNLPSLRNIGVLRYEIQDEQLGTCVDSIPIALTNATKVDALIFYMSFNVFAYLLPLGIISIFYILMVKRLWKKKGDLKISKEAFRIKRRITKLVWLIILTFAICWLPQNIRFALKAIYYPSPIFWEKYDNEFFFAMQIAIQLLAYANSCMNPILYGVLSERFRDFYRQIRLRRFGRSVDRKFISETR